MRLINDMQLKNRRRWAILVTLIAIALFVVIIRKETDRLGMPTVVSGLTLIACLTLLMLIGIRRRIRFLPLGNVSTWLQIHLYLGVFTTAVFITHAPVLIADGIFERTLSLLFLAVTGSGFYGIYASRTVPKKLTAIESQYRFDSIPWTRHQIAHSAESSLQLVDSAAAAEVLQDFYVRVLVPFFQSRPTFVYVVSPNGNQRRKLLSELKDLDRYLEPDARQVSGQLAALIRRRDDLDYQFALQLRLRCWVMAHSVLSLLLYAASVIHGFIVLRYLDWS